MTRIVLITLQAAVLTALAVFGAQGESTPRGACPLPAAATQPCTSDSPLHGP